MKLFYKSSKYIMSIYFLFNSFVSYANTSHDMLRKVSQALNMIIHQQYSLDEKKQLNDIKHLKSTLQENLTKINNVTVAHMAGIYSIPEYPWGELLMAFTKAFNPHTIIELGTCIGISSAYFAIGANSHAKIFTLEHFKPLIPIAEKNHTSLNHNNVAIIHGKVENSLQSIGSQHKPIDMIFDDHIHKKQAVLKYFNIIYPFLADEAVYIFDDINRNESMIEAWQTLKEDNRIAITISFTLGLPYPNIPQFGSQIYPRMGVALISKNTIQKQHFDIVVPSLEACKKIIFENNQFIIEH